MPKKGSKESGKVVKIKRARRSTKLPSLKLILIVTSVIIISLAIYSHAPRLSEGAKGTAESLKPQDILKDLAAGNASVALIYDVSGDLLIGNGTVLNVYDRLAIIVQPYSIATNESNSSASWKYAIRSDITSQYLSYYLLSKLGNDVVANDTRDILLNINVLKRLYGNVSYEVLGIEKINNKVLGDVEVEVYEYSYDSLKVRAYYEVTYGVPVELDLNDGGYVVRLTLSNILKLS